MSEDLCAALVMAASDNEDLPPPPPFLGAVGIAVAAAEDGRDGPGVRIEGYIERIVPGYSDQVFKEHFRMMRVTFNVSHIFEYNSFKHN